MFGPCSRITQPHATPTPAEFHCASHIVPVGLPHAHWLRSGCRCRDRFRLQARGSLPDVVPYDGIGTDPGGPVWQVAYIVIARHHWKHYGDPAPIKEHWAGLTDLMAYFQRHVDKATGLLLMQRYGDWVCVNASGGCPRTPASMVTAFYYVQALGFLAELAVPAGRPAAEAQSWGIQHNQGVRAFHAKFYNATAGGYAVAPGEPRGSQTSNSMALALGAPPDAATLAKVKAALVENTAVINSNHTTFGIVGSVWTHPMLEAAGRGDVALSTLTTDAYPGFGHMVANNMTTLCENWKCGFHDPGGGSQNHIMYGAFDAWMIEALGGMRLVSNGTVTGWQHFTVRPNPAAVVRLGAGGQSIRTRFGLTVVDWKWEGTTKECTLNLTVPIGSTAEVSPSRTLSPGLRLAAVAESGKSAWSAATPSDAIVVGSGTFTFIARYI